MTPSRNDIVSFLRSIHARPGGTAALLNMFRAGEVRGGSDVMVLTELVPDSQLRLDLARHAMDEARHAYLLLRRMGEMGELPRRLPPELDRLESLFERCRARDPKQVYNERGAIGEAEMMEFMSVALILEHEAATKLRLNVEALEDDPTTLAVLTTILRDEQRHVDYLEAWLERFGKRFSSRAVGAARERLQDLYRQLDVIYYASLHQYFDSVAPLAA